jgi:hypothetical protein
MLYLPVAGEFSDDTLYQYLALLPLTTALLLLYYCFTPVPRRALVCRWRVFRSHALPISGAASSSRHRSHGNGAVCVCVCVCRHVCMYVCSCKMRRGTQHTSAYVSTRQHTSAYVSIRHVCIPGSGRRAHAAAELSESSKRSQTAVLNGSASL